MEEPYLDLPSFQTPSTLQNQENRKLKSTNQTLIRLGLPSARQADHDTKS